VRRGIIFTADCMEQLELKAGKKVYFASDFHFGIPDAAKSREREKLVCAWLREIAHDAQRVYLLGDLFDAWMEYDRVVPKGSIRFLGQLAAMRDAGIEVEVFTGNHDLWMRGYFEEELQIPVHKDLKEVSISGKKFVMGHGDGISPREKKYRLLKGLLHHPLLQWVYRKLHPDWGLAIADYFSRLGPKHKYEDLQMKEEGEEYQLQFAAWYLQKQECDYFVFGHRHIPLYKELTEKTVFVNLGDWLNLNTYAVFDGKTMSLKKY
jgi:UDP-2,3-diacylglucosamine hydrolase